MEQVRKNGFYAFNYRLLLDGEPRYVSLRAALVEEQDGPVLIIGVNNIDAQVKHELDYEQKLSSAYSNENLDLLTGVKNKAAYMNMSEHLSRQIEESNLICSSSIFPDVLWLSKIEYAIVLCRVSDLEHVNETKGHEAGDQLLRNACDLICNTFKHSPVFRVAGDEFAVIAQGHDYATIDSLILELIELSSDRELVISCGMAKYDRTQSVASVFARAEHLCGEKIQLKIAHAR